MARPQAAVGCGPCITATTSASAPTSCCVSSARSSSECQRTPHSRPRPGCSRNCSGRCWWTSVVPPRTATKPPSRPPPVLNCYGLRRALAHFKSGPHRVQASPKTRRYTPPRSELKLISSSPPRQTGYWRPRGGSRPRIELGRPHVCDCPHLATPPTDPTPSFDEPHRHIRHHLSQ